MASNKPFDIPEVGGIAKFARQQQQQHTDPEEDRLFNSAKAYLMQADADGQSVYDLLYKTVYAMMEENPEDVANHPEKLNEVLSMLKKHQFEGVRVPTATHRDVREVSAKTAHPTQMFDSQRNLALLEQPKPTTETKIERPSPGVTITTTTTLQSSGPAFQSVAKDNSMWRYCGYGLPEQEAFLLDQSVAKLAREKKLEEVRFVGKIFGLRGNYLIVSSKRYVDPAKTENIFKERYTMPKPPRKNTTVDVQREPAYVGCNQKSFWVTSCPSDNWVLLPDTTPQHINAARRINKLFTGELDAPVVVHPPFHNKDGFHGLESEYLRAQLSRIVAATYISPAGALERYEPEDEEEEDEDDEPVDEDGKPKAPKAAKYRPLTVVSKDYSPDAEAGVAGLADLEQWVHSEPFIFKDGRMTKVPPKPEADEDEEPEDEPAEDEEEEEAAQNDKEPEEEEEEERDLFQPIKRDYLYGVINVPAEPNPEEEEEDEYQAAADNGNEGGEEELDAEALAEKEREEEEALKKPLEDDDVADDDPLKKKVSAWTLQVVNAIYKKHGVAAVRSVRWPGAIAFAANGGKYWGAVYLGDGLKKTDYNFVPTPAPRIQRECKDLTEVMDPTASNEKLVMRGEEPREHDSEDEQPDEEEEEN